MGTVERVWYPGAIYHITARGNHKDDIFRDKEDFQVFLQIMEEALEYYENDYEVICYCLMTNHIHLIVRTGEKHICHFIRRINAIYAKFFNGKAQVMYPFIAEKLGYGAGTKFKSWEEMYT
jgi:REP element-mobilizing transposase RayT